MDTPNTQAMSAYRWFLSSFFSSLLPLLGLAIAMAAINIFVASGDVLAPLKFLSFMIMLVGPVLLLTLIPSAIAALLWATFSTLVHYKYASLIPLYRNVKKHGPFLFILGVILYALNAHMW